MSEDNKTCTYEKSFITNSTGEFDVSIISEENLTAGLNYLRFEVLSNQFFKRSIFEFQIYYGNIYLGIYTNELGNSQKEENDLREILILGVSTISWYRYSHHQGIL